VNIFKSKRQQRHPSDLSESTRLEILKDNALDLELYEEAVVIFEKQLEDYRRSVSAKVRTSFNCDLNGVLCKGKVVNSGWISADDYQRKYREFIKSGKHNECSYECSRQCRLPWNEAINRTTNPVLVEHAENHAPQDSHQDDDISASMFSAPPNVPFIKSPASEPKDEYAEVSVMSKTVAVICACASFALAMIFTFLLRFRSGSRIYRLS
jgi:hypothetical protein